MATQTLRTLHSYVGIFVAPTILFFALTGSLQLFSLHEKHGNYRPSELIQKLAKLHKDQVFLLPHDHQDADDAPATATQPHPAPAKAAEDNDDDTPTSVMILKYFFLFVSLSLVVSTFMGLWIGLTHLRRKRLGWMLLAAGVLLPLILVAI
jgi:hypothetical protein